MNRKKGKFFLIMYLTNAITIIVTIIMLSFILLINFEKIGTGITSNYMSAILKQITNTADYQKQYITAMGLQLLIDTDIIPIIYSDDPDYLQMTRGTKRLNSYRLVAPFIDSIYVYNSKKDRFLSTKYPGLLYNDEFYDKGVKEIISAFSERPDKSMLPRKLHDPFTNKDSNVYTYITLSEYTFSKDNIPGTIVINVSESWLRSLINEVSTGSHNNNIIITNNLGEVVSHPSSAGMFMKNLSSQEYIGRILSAKKDSGFFTTNIGGSEYFISYASSKMLDWKFISLIPQSEITRDIKKMRFTLAAICILMLIFSFILSFFTSLKVYNPLNNVIMNVLKLSPVKAHTVSDRKDELKFLSKEFSAIAEQVDHLNAQQRETKNIVKNNLLKSLLSNEAMSESGNTVKKLKELDLKIDLSQSLKLIIFIIDNYKDFREANGYTNGSLLRYAIGNMGNEILEGSGFVNEAIDLEQDRVAFLLNTRNTADAEAEITACSKRIQEAAYKYLKLSLSAIISRDIQTMNDLNTIFEESQYISVYRKKYGYECILTPEILNSIQSENIRYPLEMEKTLTDAIRLGAINNAKEIYMKMVHQWTDYPYNIINLWVQRLAFAICSTIASIEKHGGKNSDLLVFLQKLSSLETTDEIDAAFIAFFDEISSTFKSKKNNRHQLLVGEMKTKIQSSYHDENLSVTSIADSFGMSPVYINKVFKEYTTETIADYIIRIRLEKSRELLEKSEISINEISKKVGFANPKYFYTFFKKNTGVTPTEYRRNLIQ